MFCLQQGLHSACLGYVIQVTIKLLGALPKLFRNPRAILVAIKHPDNFRLAAFLGCFSAILKVSHTWNLELLKSHQQGNHDILYFLNNSLVSWVCGNNFRCVIFKDTHVFYWLVSETFRLKFYAVECHRISLMLTGVTAALHQAIDISLNNWSRLSMFPQAVSSEDRSLLAGFVAGPCCRIWPWSPCCVKNMALGTQ